MACVSAIARKAVRKFDTSAFYSRVIDIATSCTENERRGDPLIQTDFLVLGSGIAGLSFALKAADHGEVIVLTKAGENESNTKYAQGGIASVISEEDSFDLHIEDTLRAGAGLCNRRTVELVVREGPRMIRELVDLGVPFSRQEGNGEFELGMEGGHTKRRILHVRDFTGREIETALVARIRNRPEIRLLQYHTAIDLVTRRKARIPPHDDRVIGVYTLDRANQKIESYCARVVVLATGGSGKIYLYTSNPDIATADGQAMAYRAGAVLANMEFFQFHPTCLYHPKAKSFLISEAVRGEGAVLRLQNGEPFMKKYDERGELAPRDIVARAIDSEMKKRGDDYVLLDLTHRDGAFIRERFPMIYENCRQYGYDMAREPIPVVPAAHYGCGGIKADEWGRSSLPGLYAIGEVACTGLHGANRLASNSLLEALVYADRAAAQAIKTFRDEKLDFSSVPPWDEGTAIDSDEAVVISQNWDEIRRLMWNYVGIVRSDKRLARARQRIDLLMREINDYYWNFTLTSDLIELRNVAAAAEATIRSALSRKESRGLHYNLSYPLSDERCAKDTDVRRLPSSSC